MQGGARFIPVHVTAILVLLLSARGSADDSISAPPQELPGAAAVANPAGGGGSSVIERIETPAPRRHRLVYACRGGSTPIYSDRPCGEDARTQRLELTVPVAATAGSAPSTRLPVPTAATRPMPAPESREEPAPPDRCALLLDALEAVDARMRDGYSAREAARLWERWRAAKARLRDADC